MSNRALLAAILRELDNPASLIKYVKDRLAHDRRYAIDATKARRELDWEPASSTADRLAQTVAWYRDNTQWWRAVKTGEYRKYYERMYADRLDAGQAERPRGQSSNSGDRGPASD